MMSNRSILYNVSDRTVLIISMVVAALFWFLNRMTESYEMDVNIPVAYEQTDSMTFAEAPLKNVQYVVKSQGWNLLGLSKSNLEEDTILITLDESQQQTISQTQLLRFINNTQLSGFNIIDTRPELLKIRQAEATYKRVPVVLPLTIGFKSDYAISGNMSISPDSIWVKGPASEVQQIDQWRADSIYIEDLKDTLVRTVKLEKPTSKVVETDVSEVSLTIPVEQYTENTLYSTIEIVNPIDSNMSIFPSRTRLKFKVPLSRYEDVTKEDFRVIVDGSSEIIDENKLLITIARKSPLIKDLDYDPKLVEFFISK